MDLKIVFSLVSPIISVVSGFLLNKYWKSKSKIIAYYGHISAHRLKELDPPLNVFTHAIIIRNTGDIATKNVRIGHHTKTEYTVYPNIYYDEKNTGQGFEICLPVLVPDEQITISYIYFPPILASNINSYIKSDEGLANVIHVVPTPSPSTQKKYLAIVLLLVGASTIIYFTLTFISLFYPILI